MAKSTLGSPAHIRAFQKKVLSYYKKNGRHTLPWRKTHDPYKILVSEVMLQQTQVERVIPYYNAWIKRWPTAQALAKAPLSQLLTAWSGLGYNSRAKRLQEAVKAIVSLYKGRFPRTRSKIEALPGIGPYTAGAICAFAFNQDVVFIETNIRTVLFNEFVKVKNDRDHAFVMSDKELLETLEKLLPKGRSRQWYSALMDYGSYLKSIGKGMNVASKSYKKQPPLKGSLREIRGAIIRTLTKKPVTQAQLVKLFSLQRKAEVLEVLLKLQTEGLIQKSGRSYALPD
jgi:A/G-specific adenine glycosylase